MHTVRYGIAPEVEERFEQASKYTEKVWKAVLRAVGDPSVERRHRERMYRTRLLEHLVDYKENTLKITASGKWRDTELPHILPPDRAKLNLLEPYREWLWSDLVQKGGPDGKPLQLPADFCHLNNPQAMALNLFGPATTSIGSDHLPCVLGYPQPCLVRKVTFFTETIPGDPLSYVDMHVSVAGDFDAFVHCFCTDLIFGGGRLNAERTRRLQMVYRPKLAPHMDARLFEPAQFYRHHRLMRALYTAVERPDTRLVIVFPFANTRLRKKSLALARGLDFILQQRIHFVDTHEIALALFHAMYDATWRQHYMDFFKKYDIESP